MTSKLDQKPKCGSDLLALIFGVVAVALTVVTIAIAILQLRVCKRRPGLCANGAVELDSVVVEHDGQVVVTGNSHDNNIETFGDQQHPSSKDDDGAEDIAV
jgi:hypothetical protein